MNKPDEIWVPVGTPDHLNIPCLAMGVEESKKSRVDQIIDPIDILVETGDLAADWLIECEAKQFVGFYETREYLHPKTAVYQNWFVFRDQKTADEFFDLFPEFG
ncbi:MAG: hypothetical protein WBN88_20845 [Anderseniella sp.]